MNTTNIMSKSQYKRNSQITRKQNISNNAKNNTLIIDSNLVL